MSQSKCDIYMINLFKFSFFSVFQRLEQEYKMPHILKWVLVYAFIMKDAVFFKITL